VKRQGTGGWAEPVTAADSSRQQQEAADSNSRQQIADRQKLVGHATYRTVEQPLRAGWGVKGSAKASSTPSQRSTKHDERDDGIESGGSCQSLTHSFIHST